MSFTKQQLTSAWLDNEASSLHAAETETSAAGGAVDADSLTEVLAADQRDLWQRYALVGSVLRGDAEVGQPVDISAQVAARVAAEAPEDMATESSVVDVSIAAGGARTKAAMRWLKPAASAAVAASVAIVAVLSVQQWNQPVGGQNSGQSMEPALITNPLGGRNPVSYNAVGTPAANKATTATASDAQQQQRRQLQSYLIDHQQQLQLRQQAEQETTPESQPPQ